MQIALTFDAGNERVALNELLAGLDLAGVRATFFVTGRWAKENFDSVQQISRHGHEIGNHTWSHQNLTRLSDAEIATEITRTDQLLRQILGAPQVRFFRAPRGARNAHVLKVAESLGFRSVHWSIDSRDWVDGRNTPQELFDGITLRSDSELDGAIILMHVGEPSTAEVVFYLVEALHARGFKFVTISELIAPRPFRSIEDLFRRSLPGPGRTAGLVDPKPGSLSANRSPSQSTLKDGR